MPCACRLAAQFCLGWVLKHTHMRPPAGQGLKEASCINRSLTFLEQVVNSLARLDAHVPFRQTKLTALLRDALGGNSRTVMVANVWPDAAHVEVRAHCPRPLHAGGGVVMMEPAALGAPRPSKPPPPPQPCFECVLPQPDAVVNESTIPLLLSLPCCNSPSLLQETVSTLRFASRTKLLVTDAVVNESADPALLLKRAERQVRELKQELAMRDMLRWGIWGLLRGVWARVHGRINMCAWVCDGCSRDVFSCLGIQLYSSQVQRQIRNLPPSPPPPRCCAAAAGALGMMTCRRRSSLSWQPWCSATSQVSLGVEREGGWSR